MSKKYRINLDPIMERIKLGEVITMVTSGGNPEQFGPKEIDLHGTIITSDRLDCWPQALLEEIEEGIDPRYILEDAPVEVTVNHGGWVKRHWAPQGETEIEHQTFHSGQTSHTADGRIAYWDHWRIPSTMDPDEWKAKWYKPPTDEERLNNMEIKRPINL